MSPLFPLAKLAPLAGLTTLAAISAAYFGQSGQLSWMLAGLVPLTVYLAVCHLQARRLLQAEHGRDRDIVRLGFVVTAAQRSARFWNVSFSAIAIFTGVTTVAIWAYQGFLWFVEDRWIAVTWASTTSVIPWPDYQILRRVFYWLGDTNLGVVVLVTGLLIAAPLAAISWRSNNKAKFRRNDLVSLKKRS